MSVNYDITTTSATAEITIYDIYRIPQSGNTITLQTFLNNSFVEWVNDIDISWLINYSYVFEGLSPNTRYSFDIDFWEGTTVVDTIHDTFTTDSDGGGGGSDAYWDFTYTNSSVTIDVHNASGYYVSYYLRDRTNSTTVFDGEVDGRVWDKFYTISNLLSNTDYRLYVSISEHSSGGSLIDIESSNGNIYEDFTTGGGGGGGGSWTADYQGEYYPTASDTIGILSSMSANYVYLYWFLFDQTGEVTFYSTGNADTIAYLSANSQDAFDDVNGVPYNYLISDDDSGSGSNFSITYTVQANTGYYLWVRTYNGNSYSDGNVVIGVEMSGGGSTVWDVTSMSGGYNLSSTSMLESVPIYAKTLTRISFSIRKAGSVRFYSTGQLDVQVYLSTSTSYNDSTGVPNSGTITLSGNTGTSTNNFDCTATLSAGTTYYLWVRGVLESTSGSICVVIVPPSGGSVSGNGQTYIYNSGSWLEATPYIYIWNFNTNSGSWVETTPGIYVNGNWI